MLAESNHFCPNHHYSQTNPSLFSVWISQQSSVILPAYSTIVYSPHSNQNWPLHSAQPFLSWNVSYMILSYSELIDRFLSWFPNAFFFIFIFIFCLFDFFFSVLVSVHFSGLASYHSDYSPLLYCYVVYSAAPWMW